MHNLKEIINSKGDDVYSVRPDDTVEHALGVLLEHNIGAVLVLDDLGDLIGVFSERDFARHALEHRAHIFDLRVETFMSRQVRAVPEKTTIDEAMSYMTTGRMRHLPVYDNGRIAGVVSIGDVVKAVVDEKDVMIDQLEHYISSSL